MEDPRSTARALLAVSAADLWLLWVLYRGNGADAKEWELDAFIHDILVLEDYDLKLLRRALEDFSLRTCSRGAARRCSSVPPVPGFHRPRRGYSSN